MKNQVLQILITGDPNGLKILKLDNWDGQMKTPPRKMFISEKRNH